jgi:hypothetical protein
MVDASTVKVSVHIKRAGNCEEWCSSIEECQGTNIKHVTAMPESHFGMTGQGSERGIDERLISDSKYTNQIKWSFIIIFSLV